MKNSENKITVIMTVWKRDHLREQLESLLNQTLKPSCIWIQQTFKNINIDSIIEEYQDDVKYTYFSQNKGIFGRFESVQENVNTPYTFIMDDDIIPGWGFLEDSIHLSATCKIFGGIETLFQNRLLISCPLKSPISFKTHK